MSGETGIENVSDTARWVAMYRAMESERPDAYFRDPYARILAGEQGERILRQLRGARTGAWVIVTRTVVIDELIHNVLEKGSVDTVINLAAGLDSRPYRLPLPSTLRWIEVDLPEILAYKERILRQEQPRCRLERIALDLRDEPKRQEFFARMSRESQQVLVITEGLLVFLKETEVISLARDLRNQPNFRWWVQDFVGTAAINAMERLWGKHLGAGSVLWQFTVEDIPGFFESRGWKPRECRYLFRESRRLKRNMPWYWPIRIIVGFLPPRLRRRIALSGGYLLLEQEPPCEVPV